MFQYKSLLRVGLCAAVLSGASGVSVLAAPSDAASSSDSTDRYIVMGLAVGLLAFAFTRKSKTADPRTTPAVPAPELNEPESLPAQPDLEEAAVEADLVAAEETVDEEPASAPEEISSEKTA